MVYYYLQTQRTENIKLYFKNESATGQHYLLTVRAHGYLLKYKWPERIVYLCHCPVNSLMVSSKNMAAAMHQRNLKCKDNF